jgi:hypothetical protein
MVTLREIESDAKEKYNIMRRPLKGPQNVLPKHYPRVFIEKRDGKIVMKVPKEWKEEWKYWTGPAKPNWLGKLKMLKKDPMTRREILENLGMAAGIATPFVLIPATGAGGIYATSATSPALYAYALSVVGKKGGDKLEDFLEKHEGGYRFLKRKERQLEKKLGQQVEKRFEIR